MKKTIVTLMLIFLFSHTAIAQNENDPYLNSELSVNERVNDLLSRMTLREKVGQMNQRAGKKYFENVNDTVSHQMLNMLSDLKEGIVGSFLILSEIDESNKLQKIAENSRLKIPFLNAIDAIHGHGWAYGATIFPTSISQASAFNPAAVEKINAATAKEMRATGHHWAFFPYMSVTRDPRFGRVGENYGEDPLLVTRLSVAAIKGLQGDDYGAPDKVIACAKVFLGDGQSINGLNLAPMDISMRTLKEIFLPPAEGCVKAGVRTVMAAHNEINGVPAHADPWLLTELLRDEWGFEGYVISDWQDIERLNTGHRIVDNYKDGVEIAVSAGIDVHMFGDHFVDELVELVEEGKIPESRIDRAVRAILTDKFKMGLFENRYVDKEAAKKILANPEHVQLALETARESIVLLKNENNVLPLSKSLNKILVTGPLANDNALVGDWVHTQPDENIITILEGIEDHVGSELDVEYYNPGDIYDIDEKTISEAVKKSENVDAIVLVVGGNDNRSDKDWTLNPRRKNRTGGENIARADIVLAGMQDDLAKALYKTGKPVIVILINGRPLAVEWISENIPGIIEAWQPGMQGGNAVAEVLFGDYNPSGKLPMTFPRSVGHIPVFYNHRPSTFLRHYTDSKPGFLYEFGFGLSYTTFEYSNLSFTDKVTSGDDVEVKVTITNTGSYSGDEIVLVYLNDEISSVTTPVKKLVAFQRVSLKPDEAKTVTLSIPSIQLALYNREMKQVIEPGDFQVMVGGLIDKFEVVE
ncbi:MAG: glycoside hydrolase family 3 C-terminal domain-containing protein [Melioribacteraceae bacterium]|nr:glycoside hydrolase family 3 C-terminal domain-containing protein [Melioribacteraceae bacterium]